MFGIFKRSKPPPESAEKVATKNSDSSIVDYFKKSAFDSAYDMPELLETREDALRSIFKSRMEKFEFYEPPTTAKANGKSFALDESEFRKKLGSNPSGVAQPLKGFANGSYNGLAENVRDDILIHFSHMSFIGFPMCAQLAVHPFINIACSQVGKDAIASGYDLKFADKTQNIDDNGDGKDDSLEWLAAMKKHLTDLDIENTCAKMDYNKRVFGSGIAFPLVFKSGKKVDMSIPFNADGLKGAKFKGWKVVDPIWLSPVFNPLDAFDPSAEMFYKPSWYRLPDGSLVHHTWFLKVDNCEVADILKPTYYWCGVPLTQQIYERVWCFDKIANEAPLLAMSKRMLIVDANVQQIYKNRAYVYKLMSIIKKCWHNWGVFFKNESANVSQVDTTLTDLEECIYSQGQLVASIAGMPATKLLKTTPKGFNSTGEYEFKDYAQHIDDIRKNEFTPLISKSVDIITACNGERKPVVVEWNPVDAPTEEERAQVESTKANTRTAYVSAGILTVEEVRESMRTDESGEFTHIKRDNPELDRKAEMERIMRDIEDDDKKDNSEEPQKEEGE